MGTLTWLLVSAIVVLGSIPAAVRVFRALHVSPAPAVVPAEPGDDAETVTFAAVADEPPAAEEQGDQPAETEPSAPAVAAVIGDHMQSRFTVDPLGPYVRPDQLEEARLVPGPVPGWSTGSWPLVRRTADSTDGTAVAAEVGAASGVTP